MRWPDKGWGGGLILSHAQKSAATPALILPVSVASEAWRKKTRIADRPCRSGALAAIEPQ